MSDLTMNELGTQLGYCQTHSDRGAALVLGFLGTSRLMGHWTDSVLFEKLGLPDEYRIDNRYADTDIRNAYNTKFNGYTDRYSFWEDATRGVDPRPEVNIIAELLNRGYINSIFATDPAKSLYKYLQDTVAGIDRCDCVTIMDDPLVYQLDGAGRTPYFFDMGELSLRGIVSRSNLDVDTRLGRIRSLLVRRHRLTVVWGWSQANLSTLFLDSGYKPWVMGRRSAVNIEGGDKNVVPGESARSKDARAQQTEDLELFRELAQCLGLELAAHSAKRQPTTQPAPRLAPESPGKKGWLEPAAYMLADHRCRAIKEMIQISGKRIIIAPLDGLLARERLAAFACEELVSLDLKCHLVDNLPSPLPTDFLAPDHSQGSPAPVVLLLHDDNGVDRSILFAALKACVANSKQTRIGLIVPYEWYGTLKDVFGRDTDTQFLYDIPATLLSVSNLQACFKELILLFVAGDTPQAVDAATLVANLIMETLNGRTEADVVDVVSKLCVHWVTHVRQSDLLRQPQVKGDPLTALVRSAQVEIVDRLRKWLEPPSSPPPAALSPTPGPEPVDASDFTIKPARRAEPDPLAEMRFARRPK